MIRVLQIVHTMECGGIEAMLMNIYRKIDRNKIQFDFLVNGPKECFYRNEILSLGGEVLNVTPKRVSFIQNIRDTVHTMKYGKYEIVHIHQDSMIAIGVWCAKRAGIKTIFTHAHTTSANGWHRKILAQLGRTYIIKNATEKFACSNAAAKWIYGKKENNFTLFKNAIDAERLEYNYDNYVRNRGDLHIKDNQLVIGTCGRLSVEKNQIFLIEVFAEFKKIKLDSKLILIGDGDEKTNILQRAKELGVIEDVICTGIVYDVEYYYSMLDVFVLPSFYEGLPLAGVEAQAAGIPSFFSTGVTSELKIVDSAYFLRLEQGAKVWAAVINEKISKRVNTLRYIRETGYDIGENVRFLQSKYLRYSINS